MEVHEIPERLDVFLMESVQMVHGLGNGQSREGGCINSIRDGGPGPAPPPIRTYTYDLVRTRTDFIRTRISFRPERSHKLADGGMVVAQQADASMPSGRIRRTRQILPTMRYVRTPT